MILRKKKFHHSGKKRTRARIFWSLVLLAIFLTFFAVLPLKNINTKGRAVVASARVMKDSLKGDDMAKVQADMKDVQTKFESFQKDARKIYWMRYIPVAGWYVSDFKHGVEAGESLINAGQKGITAIAPYADLIGFKKGGAGFADRSADDRIQTAVLTLDKIVPQVDAIAVDIDAAQKEIDKIDPSKYPGKYSGKIASYQEQFDSVASLFVDAKPFIKKVPNLLGAHGERTYIVVFQNDKELRPTGGFLTAYAIFKMKNGKMSAQRSEDIYNLDASISSHPKAPAPILAYHKGVFQLNIRDSNLSPDYYVSMQEFEKLYAKSSQKVAYDGIIAVDTKVLVDMLRVLGDTEAGGHTFSAKQDDRCDCPQVIYELLNDIDRPVNYIKNDRKGILGQLLYAIMQKALGSSPSQYWGQLTQDGIANLEEKHILMYLKDEEEQKAVEAINFAGRMQQAKGDFLHINDTNFAGAKSNLFVKHNVTSDTTIDSNGTVTRKLTIRYKNPHRASDCNLERGGLCLNAPLRNWLRIYVPQGSKLVNFKGSQTKTQTYDELGKTVFEGFMTVNPMGSALVTLEYELPNKVKNQKEYTLYIQKQPGTVGHEYTVNVNNKLRSNTPLVKDFELTLQ